uniref:Protein kinase domain-containing protein n=1 Tax=Kryptolebias marmoratus TaxID=37003 RepID=A0A3Q3BI36_KRYMA
WIRRNMGNTWFMQLRYNFPKLSKSTIIRGRLSDYIPEAIIGEGSFGQVARCRNVATQELVAIKIIDKYQMKAGKSEIRVMDHLRQLDPDKNNLVRFNEHFRYKRSHCLSFEILDISLFDYIAGRRCKSLTLMEIRVITQQMLVALDALKSIGLVHGDIKPDNIMLVDRSSLNVKLIDFGLAFQTSQIKKGWLVQNPSYRAFEVMLGIIDLIGQPDNDLLSDGDVQSFIDLLKKMFELDPQKRISPAEALGHNFITMKHLSGNPDSKYVIDAKNTIKTAKLQWEMEPPSDTSDDSSFPVFYTLPPNVVGTSAATGTSARPPLKRNIIHVKPLRATSPTASRRSAPEDLPGPFTGSVKLKALALEKRVPPPPRAAKASVPKRAFPSRGDDSSFSSGSPRASSAPERWPANVAKNQIESPADIKAPKKSCSRIRNFFLRIFRSVL